jgi:hypothetical protein
MVREGVRSGSGRVSLEQASSIPYATLAYRVNGSSEAMLVLATDSNGDQLWTAASRVVLMTRDGRILRSVGMPHNRGATASQGASGIPAPSQALSAPYRSIWLVDFPDVELHGVIINCFATARGRQLVNVLGTRLATTRVDEVCQSRDPRWSFTDSYWIDAGGFVWQSIQHLHPAGTRVQIKILRPPG